MTKGTAQKHLRALNREWYDEMSDQERDQYQDRRSDIVWYYERLGTGRCPEGLDPRRPTIR